MVRPTSMTTSSKRVVVVGAGLVGAIQSLLLARDGHQVTVIERRSFENHSSHKEDPNSALNSRTVALSHRSWQLLNGAGLWPTIACSPIQTVHVTERGKFGSIKLSSIELQLDALGYVVSNSGFESFLYNRLKNDSGVELIESASVTSLSNTAEGVTVCISADGGTQTIDADLLIAADGAKSGVRSMLGISVDQKDYDQCAVIANVTTAKDHHNVAYERFTDSGPLAMLPLWPEHADSCTTGGNRYSMIYTITTRDRDAVQSMQDSDFLALLQKRFGGRSGRFTTVGKRFIVPLQLTVSSKQIEKRCILVGNASRSLHPVAGQGLNLAVRDMFELVSCLRASYSRTSGAQSDNCTDTALRMFSKKRRGDQWAVTKHTDLLAQVFTSKPWMQELPLSAARSSSFLLLDFIDPLRKKFAAMNIGEHVPLAR